MLELHVWGPAFGLPSIDAECIAAITYLHNAVPEGSAWRLVPNNDTSMSPSGLLPALIHDGVRTSGYRAIVSYLVDRKLTRDLDASLDAPQRADAAALHAFLAGHAAPLLDLSLYVSAANWSAVTRPAYSSMLRFPLAWTIPPLIRADAVRGVAHLGLASLDAEFDPHGDLHLSATGGGKRWGAGIRKTVREKMAPEQAAAIRLAGLADNCLGVLERVLVLASSGADSTPRFFGGRDLTSVDCLALGYLALMLRSPVPQAFLRDWMVEHAPRLAMFVDRLLLTSVPADNSPVWATALSGSSSSTALVATVDRLADSVARHLPIVGVYYAGAVRCKRCKERGATNTTAAAAAGIASRLVAVAALAIAVACGGFARWYRGRLPVGACSQLWRAFELPSYLRRLNKLGIMLDSAIRPAVPGTSLV